MVTLIIARHCESTWHVTGRLAGQKDKAVLTAKGKKQALEFSRKLRKYPIDTVYSSGLRRSIQTAEIIGKFLDKSITKTPGLNERSWGQLEGRLNSEVQSELENRFNFVPSKGESFSDFVERITNTILEILEQQDHNTILVVTHGGVKEAFEMLFKTLKPSNLDNLAIVIKGIDANVIQGLEKSYN